VPIARIYIKQQSHPSQGSENDQKPLFGGGVSGRPSLSYTHTERATFTGRQNKTLSSLIFSIHSLRPTHGTYNILFIPGRTFIKIWCE